MDDLQARDGRSHARGADEEVRALRRQRVGDGQGHYTGLTTDPIGFGKELGKSLLDWDTWADDPARAIGHLVPDAVIAVATAGTGALATRGAKGGLDAMDAPSDLNKLDNLSDLSKLDRFDELTGLRRLDDLPDDLRGLVNKPIDDLIPGEIDRLVEARNAIRVEPGTPMQRVIPEGTVDDYLRGSSDTNPTSSPTRPSGSPRGPRTSTSCTPRARARQARAGLHAPRRHPPVHARPVRHPRPALRPDRPGRARRAPAREAGGRRHLQRPGDRPRQPVHRQRLHLRWHPRVPDRDPDHHAGGFTDLADGQLGRPGARRGPHRVHGHEDVDAVQ